MNVRNMNLGFTASQGNVINAYAAGSRVPPSSGTAMPAGLMSFNQEQAARLAAGIGESLGSQNRAADGVSRGSSNYLQSNQGLARADLGMTDTYNQRNNEEGSVRIEGQQELVEEMARSTLKDSERDDDDVVGDINARE